MLMRLVALAAVIFVVVKTTTLGEEQLRYVLNLTARVTTQNEVNAVSRLLFADFVADRGSVPRQSDDDWSIYIREHMAADAGGRNTALDIWQHPYRIREEENVDGRKGYIVRSAGPDATYGTGDDIIAARAYPR